MLRFKNIFFLLVFLFQNPGSIKAGECDTTVILNLTKRSKNEISRNFSLSYRLALEAYAKAQPCMQTFAYYDAALCLSGIYNQKDQYDSVISLLLPLFKKLPAN